MLALQTYRFLIPGMMLLAVAAVSCSSKEPNRKATFPVTGTVYVDGSPAAGVTITLTDVAGMDTAQPTMSTAVTKEDGTFAVSTYDESDGVPAGEYAVTFSWGEYNVFSRSYEGDKLKKRYSDPQKSQVRVTVTEGSPTDLGQVDLTTR